MLAAVLLGVAVGVVLLPAAPQHRLRRLARVEEPRGRVPPERLRQLACGCLGLLVAHFVGAPFGLLLGTAVGLVGPRAMDRADSRLQRADQELARQLPLALDLLAACLAGGSGITTSLMAVATGTGGPVGERLRRVASALSLGTPPAEAFRELGSTGAAAVAARSLCRASEGGAPIANAVAAVAEQSRRQARLEARKAARRAGNLATAPLTLCFLPAFLVLGIVPCFVGVAAPILSSF